MGAPDLARDSQAGGDLCDFLDIEREIAFITNFAEDHALALPGRIPGCKREVVKLLPSSETKVKVYGKCRQAGNNHDKS